MELKQMKLADSDVMKASLNRTIKTSGEGSPPPHGDVSIP